MSALAVTLNEEIITFSDTSTVALYASAKPCLWAQLIQHTTFNAIKFSTGVDTTPTSTSFPSLVQAPALGANPPPMYDLATIMCKANAASDKVIVRYATLA